MICVKPKDGNTFIVTDAKRNVRMQLWTTDMDVGTLVLPCVVRVSNNHGGAYCSMLACIFGVEGRHLVGSRIDDQGVTTDPIRVDRDDVMLHVEVFCRLPSDQFVAVSVDDSMGVDGSPDLAKFSSSPNAYFPFLKRSARDMKKGSFVNRAVMSQALREICVRLQKANEVPGSKRPASSKRKAPEEPSSSPDSLSSCEEEQSVASSCSEAMVEPSSKKSNTMTGDDAARVQEMVDGCERKMQDSLADFAKQFQSLLDQSSDHFQQFQACFNQHLDNANEQVCSISVLLDSIKEKSAVLDAVLARAGAQPRPFVQWVREGLRRTLVENKLDATKIEWVAINMQARVGDEMHEFAVRLPREILHFMNEMDNVSSMHGAGWAIPLQRMLYDALSQAFNDEEMTRVMDIAMKMKASMPACRQLYSMALRLPMPLARPFRDSTLAEDTFSHMPFGAILRDALERANINNIENVDMVGFDAHISFYDGSPAKNIVIAIPDTVLRVMANATPLTPGRF